jgi:hypothetical protein
MDGLNVVAVSSEMEVYPVAPTRVVSLRRLRWLCAVPRGFSAMLLPRVSGTNSLLTARVVPPNKPCSYRNSAHLVVISPSNRLFTLPGTSSTFNRFCSCGLMRPSNVKRRTTTHLLLSQPVSQPRTNPCRPRAMRYIIDTAPQTLVPRNTLWVSMPQMQNCRVVDGRTNYASNEVSLLKLVVLSA